MAIIKDGSRNVELTGKDKEEYIKHRFPNYSGQTNMFGAAAFIQADFECSKNMSIRYLSEWMKSYKGENNDND